MKRRAPVRVAEAAIRFGFVANPDGHPVCKVNRRSCKVCRAREWGVQRFIRYVLSAEQRSGEKCIVRMGTEKMPRYFVTDDILKRICPELFPKRDIIAEELRAHVEHVEERLHELSERDTALAKQVAGKIDELRASTQAIARRVDILERTRVMRPGTTHRHEP